MQVTGLVVPDDHESVKERYRHHCVNDGINGCLLQLQAKQAMSGCICVMGCELALSEELYTAQWGKRFLGHARSAR